MDRVYVVGVAMTPFGKHLRKSVRDLTEEGLRDEAERVVHLRSVGRKADQESVAAVLYFAASASLLRARRLWSDPTATKRQPRWR
jgi:acetyl-CoA acetyltransferase